MTNNTPDYNDNLYLEEKKMNSNPNVICNDCKYFKKNAELTETNEALKVELKEVCDVLIRKCPEMKEWVMLNWNNLYEVKNESTNIR